jgi:hypothetical protein
MIADFFRKKTRGIREKGVEDAFEKLFQKLNEVTGSYRKNIEVKEVKEFLPAQAPKGRCIPADGAAIGNRENRELDGRNLKLKKSKNFHLPKP